VHTSTHRVLLSRLARGAAVSRYRSICVVAFSIIATSAIALSPLPPVSTSPTLSGTIRVTPETGLPGQERTITFSGVWHNGCIPVAGGVAEEPANNPVLIRLRINILQTLAPCIQAITPYELSFKYTPNGANLAIIASTNDQRVLANGSLVIADLQAPIPNLSGTWINWTRFASTLNLTQSTASNAVVGNWGTFNLSSSNTVTPISYFIHSSRPVSGNVYEATLTQYGAEEFFCNPLDPSCTPGFRINRATDVGIVRITLFSKDVITVEARTPGPDGSSSSGKAFLFESFSRFIF
jgi:hypothetical protein